MKELKGIITAMVTPFDETEKMDIPAAKNMARWLVDKGVHGLFICGTNGEFHLLSDDEKVELTKAVVEEVGGEVTICAGAGAGAGCCSTKQTIELTKRLVNAGADYISVVTPYYLVPNQEDLYRHYRDIANSTTAPIILYNLPGQTGLSIEYETANRLADIENIVAIKDSSGKFEVQKQYLEIAKHKNFKVLNGSDSLMLDAFKEGSVAAVAATSNVLPTIEVDLYNYFMAGELDKAQEERNKMDALRMTIKKMTAPAVMKKALNLMGVQAGITRRPIHMPNEAIIEDIKEMLKSYNFL
ncbi:4-hydroxy-tetrahydrodipicolinate synthase [Escherichia albertii]|uniref:4-hydroxy-tetrahydrodipicolinate synthase n=1 Tax=Escherichia albertii TaxID=208962 RepID=UPI00235DF5D9|nr:4-hydroxy-tetrahydrodipicolinate synthase [Escherichia albertii]WDB42308.1 4-hydroxy-tetrahydrodipicolinate synthase [Escherichia albertii]